MKKIIFLASLIGTAGCQHPYVNTPKRLKEFTINHLQLYLITNRSQFPVTPLDPNTVGMWVLRYGMQEEIWCLADVDGTQWAPAPGVLEQVLMYALNHRDRLAIQNPEIARAFGDVIILHESQ